MATESTDEDLAASWEASVGGDQAAADDAWDAALPSGGGPSEAPQSIAQQATGSERILNQDEIDSLLGFSMDEENSPNRPPNGVFSIFEYVSRQQAQVPEVVESIVTGSFCVSPISCKME